MTTDIGRRQLSRRATLRGLGVATVLGSAGCLGDDEGPPEAANEYGYETVTDRDVDVPLVPMEDAIEWFHEDDTAFVDARNRSAYEQARIEGALLSPAADGQDEDDPVEQLPVDTRIVTYCVCPHALATSRGSSLISEGYVHTYALDEGLEPWFENGYPSEGESNVVYGHPDPDD